ncbi:MAG: Asp-tRNA(Asn)/Glu-tRNA(Gln) amidotransferase subunit GatA [Bdellovibrionales bacterium]
MAALNDLTIAAALDGLKKKEFTATELTKAHVTAMEKCRPLNVFITETPERALADAAESDKRYAAGNTKLLDGIPVGVKDNFCVTNVRTTAGSQILHNFVPPYESTVSGKLWNAGAVCMGKMNMDEFAMGSSNTTSWFGPVINPWSGPDPANANRKLVPGGTSGGSTAGTAARCVMGATGSETGGSIRQPAHLCGVVGLKPTYGRCSRFGVVAYGSSLDCPSLTTRSVTDIALMLEATAGWDPNDSTSINVPVPDYRAALTGNIKGLKVGIPKEYYIDGIPKPIINAWDRHIETLKKLGAEIVSISLPHTKYAVPTYYIIAPAEASSNLARYDGVRYGLRVPGKDLTEQYENTRAQGFGKEVRRRIIVGTHVLSAGYYDAYYLKAQRVRRKIYEDFVEAYKKCDVIFAPSAPSLSFAIGEKTDDPIQMYLEDVFTIPTSLAGLPGINIPCELSEAEKLPVGLQFMGRHFEESTILNAAFALEQALNLNPVPPFKA